MQGHGDRGMNRDEWTRFVRGEPGLPASPEHLCGTHKGLSRNPQALAHFNQIQSTEGMTDRAPGPTPRPVLGTSQGWTEGDSALGKLRVGGSWGGG